MARWGAPAGGDAMTQPSLFDSPCPEVGTAGTVVLMRDSKAVRRLVSIADRIQRSGDVVEHARLAAEARDVAESIVATALREANAAGKTWRELGAAVSVPFQTLHRRYGG